MISPLSAVKQFWHCANGEQSRLEHISFEATDQQLPSVFNVGALAGGSVGAQALAAAQLWHHRTGIQQDVTINMRHALALFCSESLQRLNGRPLADIRSPLTTFFQAGDGRWIQLHANFAHHRAGIVRVLGCDQSEASVRDAIGQWQAAHLDARLADEGLCAAMVRTEPEWLKLPAAQSVADLPLFEIRRIGDGPPIPVGRNSVHRRPLSGVRVLDLSRVIAAPVAARTLAQHGAEVLAISAPHLPNIEPLLIDTGRGKRNAQLDLRNASDRTKMMSLCADADVFLQAYRPQALHDFGLIPEALVAANPGLIVVNLSAYGHLGPWANRRGFDSLVQSASGIAHAEGQAAQPGMPGKLPCQALDHATGNLAAFATMMALERRAREGGSWMVRISLAQTGHWLRAQQSSITTGSALTESEIQPWIQKSESPYGSIASIKPVEKMSATPPYFEIPASPVGTHAAQW
ncbi:MAG: CoA transferase [Burkholderiaceae bacterium]